MAKLSVMTNNKEASSPGDWYQVMGMDELDQELGTADREIFNYSVDYYTREIYASAYKGFCELAGKNCAASQYFLGVMYLKGYGVLQDFVQAHIWFNIAASKGYGKARSHLDKLTKRMSPDQIAEAQKLARERVESMNDEVSHSVID